MIKNNFGEFFPKGYSLQGQWLGRNLRKAKTVKLKVHN